MFYPWSEVYCLPASYATVRSARREGGVGGECKCRKGRRTDGWLLGDLQGLYPSIRGKKANNVVGGRGGGGNSPLVHQCQTIYLEKM